MHASRQRARSRQKTAFAEAELHTGVPVCAATHLLDARVEFVEE